MQDCGVESGTLTGSARHVVAELVALAVDHAPLIPPPASHMVKAGRGGRDPCRLPQTACGRLRRPKSPAFRRACRDLQSVSRPAIGKSVSPQWSSWFFLTSSCASQAPGLRCRRCKPARTARPVRSSRRASRQLRTEWRGHLLVGPLESAGFGRFVGQIDRVGRGAIASDTPVVGAMRAARAASWDVARGGDDSKCAKAGRAGCAVFGR